jgi:hypothetical protein
MFDTLDYFYALFYLLPRIQKTQKRIWSPLVTFLVTGAVLSNLFAAVAFTYASTLNYPGGQALHSLGLDAQIAKGEASVYIDNLAAQTGASLFFQSGSPPFGLCDSNFSNSPLLTSYHKFKNDRIRFTHVIVEEVEEYLPPSAVQALSMGRVPATSMSVLVQKFEQTNIFGSWRPLAVVYGFDGWGRHQSKRVSLARYIPTAFVSPKLWILQQM